MKYAVEVQDLVKRYVKSEVNAVDHISFKVEEGAFFAFLGPNGAGKTTTISILNTTLSKTSGKVQIAGYDLDREQKKIRERIGVIFQNPSLDQNLTAEENIRLHCSIYGLYPFRPIYRFTPRSYQQKVEELSSLLGIAQDMFKPIKTFSGGMKRKLEIIRSLMHEPKVLFLDEPTSGLDPEARKNLWEYLSQVRRSNKMTMFLTTHYLEEAEGADTVCVIKKGRVVEYGTPREIKDKLLSSYIIASTHEKERLREELTRKQIPFHATTGDKVRIYYDKTSVQSIIKAINTPLSSITIYNPSLEEAYLKIINEDRKEGVA